MLVAISSSSSFAQDVVCKIGSLCTLSFPKGEVIFDVAALKSYSPDEVKKLHTDKIDYLALKTDPKITSNSFIVNTNLYTYQFNVKYTSNGKTNQKIDDDYEISGGSKVRDGDIVKCNSNSLCSIMIKDNTDADNRYIKNGNNIDLSLMKNKNYVVLVIKPLFANAAANLNSESPATITDLSSANSSNTLTDSFILNTPDQVYTFNVSFDNKQSDFNYTLKQ